MRIACLGGGPAGLYFAISMKLRNPEHQISVFERNRSGVTFGWGVVFSDQTLANLVANDAQSANAISDNFAHWDDIEVNVSGRSITSSGHGFIGIGRRRLLEILQARAKELGVELHFESEFGPDLTDFADYDLIVAADGINSLVRTAHADKLGVEIECRRNKFSWLGTTKLFGAFAFLFEQTEAGWIWAHAYRFDKEHSTFIVECSPETWEGLGFDGLDQVASIALCEHIFARHLDGHRLISNASHLRGSAAWINFRRVQCKRWSFDNVVLLGDAAHTAHFSIGSGTKLALEDAIKLAEVLAATTHGGPAELANALADYQQERQLEVLKIQNSARNSTEWFEALDRYIDFDLPQFAYALMTRSQRVSHENLRMRDRKWLESVEQWFSPSEAAKGAHVQPMFTPFALRNLKVQNRVVIPPMLTYSANEDGRINEFHAVHYGSRALGGAGLIMTETLAVSADGRMTTACPGLYDEAHVEGWRAINAFAHQHSKAKTCAQIGHAGARASCRPPQQGIDIGTPLPQPWDIVAASSLPWRPEGMRPREASTTDIQRICDDFVQAARRADKAGFDMLEVHAGHGTLLSSFITPVMNKRRDEYGGSLDARLRFPLQVIAAVREVWPEDKPLAVRLSANDWVGPEGITPAAAVEIARRLKAIGVDLIDVSAGETAPDAAPIYGRLFQTPFADQIRNEAKVPVIAVGNIVDADQVNSIVTAGRADLVALGRPHLADPAWTLRAAAEADDHSQYVPPAYILGQQQAKRLAGRRRAG